MSEVHIVWRPTEKGFRSYWSYRRAWWRALWMGFVAPLKTTPIILSLPEEALAGLTEYLPPRPHHHKGT